MIIHFGSVGDGVICIKNRYYAQYLQLTSKLNSDNIALAMAKTTILIADDQVLFSSGLRKLLEDEEAGQDSGHPLVIL